MGSTFLCQRCCASVKKNEEELGLWCFKDDSFGNSVVYLEGKESMYFWGAKLCPYKISSSNSLKPYIVGVMHLMLEETCVFWVL